MLLWNLWRGDSPLIVSVPHAGRHVPDAIALRLSDRAREGLRRKPIHRIAVDGVNRCIRLGHRRLVSRQTAACLAENSKIACGLSRRKRSPPI